MTRKQIFFFPKVLLLGLTTSGASFTMSTQEVSSIGSSLTTAVSSIFGIVVQLAPYLAALAGIWFIYKMVSKKLSPSGKGISVSSSQKYTRMDSEADAYYTSKKQYKRSTDASMSKNLDLDSFFK